ncbi:MAG: SAM-dependent methyltransferase [Acidimicrobiales bacterium]|nr:SAM-dependent methyltransferase [Acidimicrobiales bacterium]
MVTIDSTVAHTSRIYDYLLGGTDNFAIDREVADHAFAAYPGGLDGARHDARANRAFLGRAVRYLAGEAGIRQFLDIGTGIPNADNTHAVARSVAPDARIVYVDNDPIVLAHAHALLDPTAEGRTAYVDGDLRDPQGIIDQAAATLDFRQPVALVLVGLLHVIPDDSDPYGHVADLVEAVAPGSYLVLSHLTSDVQGGDMSVVHGRLDERMRATNPPALRSRDDVARFLDGLDLVEPGVVPAARWRPDEATGADDRPSPLYAAVGRKA